MTDSTKFTDRLGREWDLTLTLGTVRRIDQSAEQFKHLFSGEFCLLRPSKELLQALYFDMELIGSLAWHIIQPQAEEKNITEDEFVNGLDGQSIQAACEAFGVALEDFFRGKKSELSALKAAADRARMKAQEQIRSKTETINQAVDKYVEREVDRAFAEFDRELGETSLQPSQSAA